VQLPDRLAPLRERNFRLLFLGRLASLWGSSMAPIALAFAVIDDLDGSPSALGLVLAAGWLPQIVFILLGGVLADRLPRHRVMVAADVVSGTAQLTAGALLLTGGAEIWHLAVVQVVRFPASAGLVPQTVSAARLQEANALLRLTQSGTNIVGAAAGGLLVAAVGSGWAIAFDGATYLAGAVILSLLRVTAAGRLSGSNTIRELREGWQEFSARTWLWVIVAAAAFTNAATMGGYVVLGPVVADRELGGAAAWGLVVSAGAAGFIVGGVVCLRLRPQRYLLVGTTALLLVALPLVALATHQPTAVVAAAAFASGFGLELFGVFWETALQQHVPLDRLSRVSSYDALGSFVFIPVGQTLAGPLSALVGIEETQLLCAAVVVGTTLAALSVADVRHLRRVEPVDVRA
jgi:predicted MFS family arabinose efflux permease